MSHTQLAVIPRRGRPRKAVPQSLTTATNGEGGFDPGKLGRTTRARLERLEHKLERARSAFGRQGLRIGEVLFKINALLAPHRMFNAYLQTVPWMPPATAYRFIRAFEFAKDKLSEPVLERVITSGLPMFGTETKPYGRFTEAVGKVGDPPTSEKQADQWLEDVQRMYKKERVGHRRGKKRPQDIVSQCASVLLRYYRTLDGEKGLPARKFIGEVEEKFTALLKAA